MKVIQGEDMTMTLVEDFKRRCGDCTLCCRVLPMMHDSDNDQLPRVVGEMLKRGIAKPSDFKGMLKSFDKPAQTRCLHQRHTGCSVYAKRPFSCRYWNCRWLTSQDTDDMPRPDRAGYVLDIMPDFITMAEAGKERVKVQVVQVWIDARRPDAWRKDDKLRAYLERRGREGIAALIRFSGKEAFTLFPPAMSIDGQWHEVRGNKEPEHRSSELFEGLAACRKIKLEV